MRLVSGVSGDRQKPGIRLTGGQPDPGLFLFYKR